MTYDIIPAGHESANIKKAYAKREDRLFLVEKKDLMGVLEFVK